MSSENQQEQAPPRRVILPPLRTFIVTRENPDWSNCEPEKVSVVAHSVDFTESGALCFISYKLDAERKEAIPSIPRVFNSWLDYEEVLVSESRLIH